LVRRPYGLHAIGPQDHAIIQTHASHIRLADPLQEKPRHRSFCDSLLQPGMATCDGCLRLLPGIAIGDKKCGQDRIATTRT
jgi:hypothetical protein